MGIWEANNENNISDTFVKEERPKKYTHRNQNVLVL
jgi:hypothetical protein